MSVRYIHQRYLPDKAIDLIDEASSRVNLHNDFLVQIDDLERQLEAVEMDKEMAAQKNNFEKAANCRVEELRLTDEINKAKALGTHVPLSEEDIAGVVEAWTKIPVHRLTAQEADKLMHLEDQLHKRVIGQEEAVNAVSKAIRRSRSGFRKERKPASFVFAGPTGVGKTELAKALAEEMFGSEDALIRVDMSEYMDSFTSSKLIGAPPGYVGYDEGGQLSEKVRRRPYSVVLLDEIEKAHPDIFNVLLQILDDGRLTDNQGRVVNFENTIIIMTTNAGSQNLNRTLGFGSGEGVSLSQSINAALKNTFRPEFLNRIDEIITFEPLKREEISRITDLMLKDIDRSAAVHNMTVHVSDEVRKDLSERGYSPEFGARPLRRLIQRELEDLISEKYLSGEVKDGDHVEVVLAEDGKIALQTVHIGASDTAAAE
jgi:ATP-dependent Clp protease ATP-binding subunit ClpA